MIICWGAIALVTASCSSGDSEPTTNISDLLPPPASSTTTTGAPTLTEEAREWCRFTGATEADAVRFDQIFEAGLGLGLNMDVVNATAGGKRLEYEEAGMSVPEGS